MWSRGTHYGRMMGKEWGANDLGPLKETVKEASCTMTESPDGRWVG